MPHFTFKLVGKKNILFMLIRDLNQGGMSVTNGIEHVVEQIAEWKHINPNDYVILYRDSEGMWDGWDNKNQKFFLLNSPGDEEMAMEVYSKTYLKQEFIWRP